MFKRGIVTAAAMAAMSLGLVGCKTGEPGVTNWAGSIETRLPAEPPEITAAAAKAVEDLQLTIIINESTALDGLVVARTARDEKIQIQVEDEGAVSEVKIRVGTFGDTATSQTILDRIKVNLGLEPQPGSVPPASPEVDG